MAITRVQYKRGIAQGQSVPYNLVVTLDSAPTNGNLLVLTFAIDGWNGAHSINSITQTGVTWTLQKQGNGFSWMDDIEIWAGVVGAGANAALTVNITGVAFLNAIVNVCENSGLLTSGFLDKTATNTGATSTAGDTGTTATTTQADELWVGVVGAAQTADVSQSSPTNGFTLLDGVNIVQSGVHTSSCYLEKIVSATGAANSGTTLANSGHWGGCIATFKAVAVAVGGAVSKYLLVMNL